MTKSLGTGTLLVVLLLGILSALAAIAVPVLMALALMHYLGAC